MGNAHDDSRPLFWWRWREKDSAVAAQHVYNSSERKKSKKRRKEDDEEEKRGQKSPCVSEEKTVVCLVSFDSFSFLKRSFFLFYFSIFFRESWARTRVKREGGRCRVAIGSFSSGCDPRRRLFLFLYDSLVIDGSWYFHHTCRHTIESAAPTGAQQHIRGNNKREREREKNRFLRAGLDFASLYRRQSSYC